MSDDRIAEIEHLLAMGGWSWESNSSDLRYLLDLVQPLRERLDQAHGRIEEHDEMRLAAHMRVELDKARAEIERLRVCVQEQKRSREEWLARRDEMRKQRQWKSLKKLAERLESQRDALLAKCDWNEARCIPPHLATLFVAEVRDAFSVGVSGEPE